MSYYSPSIEKLIEAFEKLPSIGNKTAARLAFHILDASEEETNEFITAIQERFGKLNVFLTGGDCHFFEKCLKNRIFAVENLTLIGLNELIEHNA